MLACGFPVATLIRERKTHIKKTHIKNFGGSQGGGPEKNFGESQGGGPEGRFRGPNSLCWCHFSQQNTAHREFLRGSFLYVYALFGT